MLVGNRKKVMDTLIDDCTQKKGAKSSTFLYGFTSQDSDLPPIIGKEIREQYPECFMDFNLTDDKQVYVTTLKVLNRRAKEKDFIQSFFAKSPTVYEDLKRCQNGAWFVRKIKNRAHGRQKVAARF